MAGGETSPAFTDSALEATVPLKICTSWKRGTCGSHRRWKTKTETNWRWQAIGRVDSELLQEFGIDA
jgi:hypothetical protein